MNKLLYSFLLILLSATAWAQEPLTNVTYSLKDYGRPKVAVVLAGGGGKGIAHVSALKVIEDAGIPVDLVVGTSMGSIVGGAYCAGYSPDTMKTIIGQTNWVKLIMDNPDYGVKTLTAKKDDENYLLRFTLDPDRIASNTGLGGVIGGTNVLQFFKDLLYTLPDSLDFEDLPIPFACVGTEAASGQGKVFTSGNLPLSIRASMAIPTVFTPVLIDSIAYVDGGIVDNFPVDVARQLGADIVIGVDLIVQRNDEQLVNSAVDVLMNCIDLYGKERYLHNVADADVYIPIDVTGYSAASFGATALDSLMRRGDYYANLKRPELDSLAATLNMDLPPTRIRLGDYSFAKTRAASSWSEFKENEESRKSLAGANNGSVKSSLNIGYRFDNYEMASLRIKANMVLSPKSASILKTEVRLGSRLDAKLDISRRTLGTQRIGLNYKFQKHDMEYYLDGEKVLGTDMHHHRVNLFLTQEWHEIKYTFGVNHNLYSYRNLFAQELPSTLDTDLSKKNKYRYFSYYVTSEYNTLNTQYFPTSGHRLELTGDVITTNMYQYEGHSLMPIFGMKWQHVLPLTSRMTLIPHVSGRIIIGSKVTPYLPLVNICGGLFSEMHYLQQTPMAGVSRMTIIPENGMAIAGLTAQAELFRNQYLVLTGDVLQATSKWEQFLNPETLNWGVEASYNYKTAMGPLSAKLYWSNLTKDVAFTINAGYYF